MTIRAAAVFRIRPSSVCDGCLTILPGRPDSVDGDAGSFHVAAMRWQRVLTLLLLLCGLSTTPFFSLEQSTDDGLTASSVPQCSTRILGEGFADADPDFGDADDGRGLFGPDSSARPSWTANWSSILPATSARSTAPLDHPIAGAERLTYYANAPPTFFELTT